VLNVEAWNSGHMLTSDVTEKLLCKNVMVCVLVEVNLAIHVLGCQSQRCSILEMKEMHLHDQQRIYFFYSSV
jgi:hypothetical protein